MTIFQIDRRVLDLVDPETGEIMGYEAFESLQLERGAKIENMALWVKDLTAQAKAIREEEKALAERRKSAENKAESLKRYLSLILEGEKYGTSRVAISFRKSAAVEVDEGFLEWAKGNAGNLLRFSEPTVDKLAVKEYLKAGNALELARIVESQSIQIK